MHETFSFQQMGRATRDFSTAIQQSPLNRLLGIMMMITIEAMAS